MKIPLALLSPDVLMECFSYYEISQRNWDPTFPPTIKIYSKPGEEVDIREVEEQGNEHPNIRNFVIVPQSLPPQSQLCDTKFPEDQIFGSFSLVNGEVALKEKRPVTSCILYGNVQGELKLFAIGNPNFGRS